MPIPFDATGENWRRLSPAQFEACRHAHEVNHCLAEGYDFTVSHVRGVLEHRGTRAATRLWRDVKANWEADKSVARERLDAHTQELSS